MAITNRVIWILNQNIIVSHLKYFIIGTRNHNRKDKAIIVPVSLEHKIVSDIDDINSLRSSRSLTSLLIALNANGNEINDTIVYTGAILVRTPMVIKL